MSRNVTYAVASLSSTTTPALTTSYAVRPVRLASDGSLTASTMPVADQGIGATEAQTFFVRVARANAGTLTGATFKLQVSYDGANSTTATAANWTDVQIANLADGSIAVEHTLSPAAGATAHGAFGTTGARNAPYARLLVRSTGGNAGAGESAVAYVVAS